MAFGATFRGFGLSFYILLGSVLLLGSRQGSKDSHFKGFGPQRPYHIGLLGCFEPQGFESNFHLADRSGDKHPTIKLGILLLIMWEPTSPLLKVLYDPYM